MTDQTIVLADHLNLLDEVDKIQNMYIYGSLVYGTATEKSDIDLIVVIEGSEPREEIRSASGQDKVEATIYDPTTFENKLLNHEISALECLFLPRPSRWVIREKKPLDFILDLPTLRESLSAKASNSFVKAKKKLTIEKDYNPYIAKKSLFHSLRILQFGIQIATTGKVYDYTVANNLWTEIKDNPSNNWEDYKVKYQPVYNQYKTAFKLAAPRPI